MNILYVYAHPNSASFNGMLKQEGIAFLEDAKLNIIVSDLYSEHFDAVADCSDFKLSETVRHPQYFMSQKIAYDKDALIEDIKSEIQKISWADHIILQFPLWWFSVPAILKGWLDRVLVKGFAYDTGKVFNDGLLLGKTVSLVVTTQSAEAAYQLTGVHGSTIDTFLHPIHHTFKFVGIKFLKPFVVYGAFDIDEKRKINIVANYQCYLENLNKMRASQN